MLRSKVTLLSLAFAVGMLIFPAMAFGEVVSTDGTTASSTPTIASDQADYPPGGLVTLTGSGWVPGESVNIKVNDTYGASWSRNVNVTADASGNVTDSFNLPDWFVSDYDVTATAQSGTATATFTDSQPTQVNVAAPTSPAAVNQGASADYGTVKVTMGGNANTCTVTLATSKESGDTGLPTGATATFGTPSKSTNADFTSSLSVSTTNQTPGGTFTFHVKATKSNSASGDNCNGNVLTDAPIVSTQQLTLTVTDVTAPSVAITSPSSGHTTTNSSINVSGTASDESGIQGVTVNGTAANFTYNAGPPVSTTSGTWTANNVTLLCGENTIEAIATDNSPQHKTGTASITVIRTCNSAPTVGNIGGATSATEGQSGSYTVSASDPDGDPLTYSWSITSGSSFAHIDGSATGSSVNVKFDDGPGSVGLQVVVNDGNDHPVTKNLTISVANAAPVVTFTAGATAADEGQIKNYTFSVSDPGGDAIASVSADCDADSGTDDGVLQGSQPTVANKSFDCRFADGPGSATVRASATDDDGTDSLTGHADRNVSITNVAPTLSTLNFNNTNTHVACIGANHTVTLDFTFSDPGADTFSNSYIDWGDGTQANPSRTSFSASPVSASHPYSPGSYTVNVRVEDDDSGADTDTGSVSNLYNMSTIQSPFNPDGTSTWKYGFTIPVKVQITDCNNNPVSGLAPKLGLSLQNPATPGTTINEVDLTSTSAADTGNTLRYSDGQYIYNLSTKSSPYITDQNATYWVTVRGVDSNNKTVTNAAQVSAKFGLKTK